MADQGTIHELGEEWSASVDSFLASDEGIRLMTEWTQHERPITIAILKAYADLLPNAGAEVRKHFSGKRRSLYQDGLMALEQIYAGLGKDSGTAKRRWRRLCAMVADSARGIASKKQEIPVSRRAEDLITRTLDMLERRGLEPEIRERSDQDDAGDRNTIQVPAEFAGFVMDTHDGGEDDDKPTCIPEGYDPEKLFDEAPTSVGPILSASLPTCNVSKYPASLPPPIEPDEDERPSFASFAEIEAPTEPLPATRRIPVPIEPSFTDEEVTTSIGETAVDLDQLQEWELMDADRKP